MPQFDTQFFSSLLFWEWVSFGILLLILYKYAFPWILENLDARERKIRETIEAAERQRAEAERRMAEYDARMRSAQKEAEEMNAQAKGLTQQCGPFISWQCRHRRDRDVSDRGVLDRRLHGCLVVREL